MHDARLLLRHEEGMLLRILGVGGGERRLHRGDGGDGGPPPRGPWKPPSEQGPRKPPSFSPLFCLSSAQSPRTCLDAGRPACAGRVARSGARADAGRHMCWAWLAAVIHMQFFYLHPQSVYKPWPIFHLLYGKIWPVERR